MTTGFVKRGKKNTTESIEEGQKEREWRCWGCVCSNKAVTEHDSYWMSLRVFRDARNHQNWGWLQLENLPLCSSFVLAGVFPHKHQSRIATFQFKSNVKVSWRALHLLFHLKKPSPSPSDVPGAFSPSGLCGQCSLCGSSGQQRQSVRTEEDEAEFRAAAVLQVSPSETCSSIFIPVEIWLWLQPPSSSHETRGSRTLHLWD